METVKLYYEDPLLREFTATVLSCTPCEKGYHVILDRTAFFPEGGGQACDLGTLGQSQVLDVQEQGHSVVHLCDRPLVPGSAVTGLLDWKRRFDQMQQHTGEHILSGVIFRRFGLHNVGFHVGAQVMQIDFDGPVTDLEDIEQEVNRAIWENLPVNCWYPSQEDLPTIPYRRKKDLPWPVRLVEVPGYDACACCGVHVPYTGQVGLLKILSCVKFHQGVRLELVCGKRSLDLLSRVFEENRVVSQTFSAQYLETGRAAGQFAAQLSGEKLRADTLEKQLVEHIVESYVNHKGVLHFDGVLSAAAGRLLATALAQKGHPWAAVCLGTEAPYKLFLAGQNIQQLGSRSFEALGGRGGGKPDFIQGSLAANREAIEAFFREIC